MSRLNAHRVTLHLRCRVAGAAAPAAGRPVDGLPVEGEVVCEDGSIRPFTGWLALVNELERVVASAPATRAADG